jgi:hypothetical protein
MFNLCKEVKITKIKAASTAATTEVDSDVLDMQGYEGALFFTTIGTANAGNYIKAQSGTDATVTDAADLEGTKVVAAANGQVVWLDIYKPQERYLRVAGIRGASTTLGEIYAIQYNGRKGLETNLTTNVIIGELHISPDEGTC